MIEMYEQLKKMVETMEDDIRKAQGGNKAAGTRIRKQLQDVKNQAQALRLRVLETREGEGANPPAAGNPGSDTPSA